MASPAPRKLVCLSIPALRAQDLPQMPNLRGLAAGTEGIGPLEASFPCVTWPVQANLLTGRLPAEHGVVANGIYWRDTGRVEMWTADNSCVLAPQIWDRLHRLDRPRTSAVWFPMLSKRSGADWVCMPAPIHNPDGSETPWCYTKPQEFYGELLEQLGHFPLHHFWGPLANIESSRWIARSAVIAAGRWQPDFFFIYLPHLDYAPQKAGPDSPLARQALGELDQVIGELVAGMRQAYAGHDLHWLVVSEYVITPVQHVTFPNRRLREAGLLHVRRETDGEHLDLEQSRAWAMVDHQFSHVFVRDSDPAVADEVVRLFSECEGIAEVLRRQDLVRYHLDHPRSGDVVLVSEKHSWQAYYWWLDDELAPAFARTVDIHRKPGYDPVELFWDPATRGIPLDATLVKGSHGAPVQSPEQRGVWLTSDPDAAGSGLRRDFEMTDVMLRLLGAVPGNGPAEGE